MSASDEEITRLLTTVQASNELTSFITSLFNVTKHNYIFPEKIDEIEFKKKLTDGCAKISSKFPFVDRQAFCSEINKILKEIDPHLTLQYDPEQIADHKAHGRVIADTRETGCAQFVLDGLEPLDEWFERFGREHYGFEQNIEGEFSAVPTTIGYVKINDFLEPRDGLGHLAQEEALKILDGMRGKEAVIIDLRNSHGGSPEMVEFIMSYLLTENDKSKIPGGVYNTIYDRSTNIATDYNVRPTEFNLDVPIYVLTNENTFSAAEEFAYDLQQINAHVLKDDRFTIIGQASAGGAHAMTGFPLMDPDSGAINDDYFLWVPTRTTVNPFTSTNWEDGPKKGVQPTIEIDGEDDALAIAIRIENMRPKVTPPSTIAIEPDTTRPFKDRLREVIPTEPAAAADKKSTAPTPFDIKSGPKPEGVE